MLKLLVLCAVVGEVNLLTLRDAELPQRHPVTDLFAVDDDARVQRLSRSELAFHADATDEIRDAKLLADLNIPCRAGC